MKDGTVRRERPDHKDTQQHHPPSLLSSSLRSSFVVCYGRRVASSFLWSLYVTEGRDPWDTTITTPWPSFSHQSLPVAGPSLAWRLVREGQGQRHTQRDEGPDHKNLQREINPANKKSPIISCNWLSNPGVFLWVVPLCECKGLQGRTQRSFMVCYALSFNYWK